MPKGIVIAIKSHRIASWAGWRERQLSSRSVSLDFM